MCNNRIYIYIYIVCADTEVLRQSSDAEQHRYGMAPYGGDGQTDNVHIR